MGCFHRRNKLVRRGRERQLQVKQEQSCQNRRGNGQKPPSNQRSWKHPSNLPPLITASPTSKCLRVRSGSLASVLQVVGTVASRALRRLCVCVDVGAKAVQTVIMHLPYSGEILKEINWRNVEFSTHFPIWKQNPETICHGDDEFRFCCFSLFNWTSGTRMQTCESCVASILAKASPASKRLFWFLACGRLQ